MRRVAKEDWQFGITLFFALAVFFGIDWDVIRRRVTVPPTELRQWVTLALAVIALVMGWRGWRRTKTQRRLAPATERIYGHTYRNEMVEIDGKVFDHCRFEDVTLWYRGTGTVDFIEASMKGKTLLSTNLPAIGVFERVRAALSLGGKGFQAFTVDAHGNSTPLGAALIEKPKDGGAS
jgi:hypothetical protein